MLNESYDNGNELCLRWSRCLSELGKEISFLCPISAGHAYNEISRKIKSIARPDNNNKWSLLYDTIDKTHLLDLFRNYFLFVCGCPPLKTSTYLLTYFYLIKLFYFIIQYILI